MPGSPTVTGGWPARNDMIVMMAFSGQYTQREIGKQFGLGDATISAIVNDPRAQEVISLARERLRERLLENIEDQLDLEAQASLKVLQRTLQADISPVHKAKANQDKVALSLLRGRGFLSNDTRREEEATKLTADQFTTLMSALRQSDEVRRISPFEGTTPAEVIDADDAITER